RIETPPLPAEIPSPPQCHLLPLAELRFYRRSPKRDDSTLESRDVRDCWSPIAGARGKHDGSGLHRAAIGEIQAHGFAAFFELTAVEPRRLKRNRNLDTKLQRLIEGAARKPHA